MKCVGRASGDRPKQQRWFHSMCWKEVVRQREIFLEVVTFCFLKLVPFGEHGAVIRIAGQHRRGCLGQDQELDI